MRRRLTLVGIIVTTSAAGSSGPLVVRLPASARDGGLVEIVECEGAVEQIPVLVGAGPRTELGQALDAEGCRAAEALRGSHREGLVEAHQASLLVGLVADVVTWPAPR
jgi:hypothetical protein